MAEPEKSLLAGSLVLPYDSRSVGAMEPFSGDFIIYQPLGTYAGRTKVKEGSQTQRLPPSARVSHILTSLPWLPSNTVGMLIQELISDLNK